MTLTTLDHPLPGLSRPARLPRPVAALVRWFADDPRRTRVALSGALVCAGVGAVIGLGVGWALTRAVDLAISVVMSAQA
jgi:uncharacterized membrane protein YccC